eukprot:CAMPEP_0175323982 /NCGR_PEP_ID=MMETSP0093-20121207/73257_1 /TAXON_ID=311494 /ORGANISM="Alexandrium monilatum, Strain CCMP3105" /LENGTH=106 /DNA_ID=CAMNT_0016620891 /DNA_START=237 /DNA_END=553 /DNA_ORIENTATION=-
MTPTRFPVRSTLCFQSCAWKESPLKTSTPWMLGIVGEDRAPFVKKRKRALVQSLLSVRTAQSRWVSSYVALVTAVQKQTLRPPEVKLLCHKPCVLKNLRLLAVTSR